MFSNLKTFLCATTLFFLLVGCGESTTSNIHEPNQLSKEQGLDTVNKKLEDSNETENAQGSSANSEKYKLTEWVELIPADDLETLLSPPDYLNNITDGSQEDQLAGRFEAQIEQAFDDDYQQALKSTRVMDNMDGKLIRLPGFIVPIDFNGQGEVVQFLLVPYFGACLHLPPPPPNQIILVNYPEGLTPNSLYDPYWLEGELKVELFESELANAAYKMSLHRYEIYAEW